MTTKKSFLTFVICPLLTVMCYSQWSGDARLTFSSGTSALTPDEGIAVTGDIIHIVWSDDHKGNYEIYYKASADGGLSWSPDARLTNNRGSSLSPSIAVSGPDVHIVWEDERSPYGKDIFYKRSINGGFSWSSDIRLTSDFFSQSQPVITVTGLIIHVAWLDKRNGNNEIYYKASGDGGLTWSPDARMTINSANSVSPSIVVSGPDVHLVWSDDRDGNAEIYYKRSINGGFSWSADTRLTFFAGESFWPSISATGAIVHLAWNDTRDWNAEIYYKASGDGGTSWSPDARMTTDFMGSYFPGIFVWGPYVHIVWQDNRSGNYEIFHKFSVNGGFSWSYDVMLTQNSGASEWPSVSAYDTKVHVIWTDNRDGNNEIYYKRNPNGHQYNVTNINTEINSEIPKDFMLSQNYPNPFNPVTNIKFSIPAVGTRHSASVKLIVYDITGREITTLVNQQLSAGTYIVDFDASSLASGVYFYRINTEGFTHVKKMMLVK